MQRTFFASSLVAALVLTFAISGRADSSCCSDGKGTVDQCRGALQRYNMHGYCDKVASTNPNKGYCYSCLVASATAPVLSAVKMEVLTAQCVASNCDPDVVKCIGTFQQLTLTNQLLTAPIVDTFMDMCTSCSRVADPAIKQQCACCMQSTFLPGLANTIAMAGCTLLSSAGVNFCDYRAKLPAFPPLVCA